MSFIYIALLILLLIAVLTDLSQRRIPNALTFPAMLLGLLAHMVLGGFEGLLLSTGGLALGLGLLLAFYLLGMIGGGDVKLMGAVGSFLGPMGVFQAFLFTALVGGIYAALMLSLKGQLICFLKRMGLSLYLSIAQRKPSLPPDEGQEASPILCYGLAIAAGTTVSLFFQF
jgi:prepilin peptidase CpaA